MSEGKQIDWSKAPEGATARLVNRIDRALAWATAYATGATAWRDDELGPFELDASCWNVLANRHTVPATWNGTGLPPVGTVCELRTSRAANDSSGWGVAEIMYSSKTAVVWRWKGFHAEFGSEWSNAEFRPIRTPEQIAAEEREKAIQEIDSIINEQMGRLNVRELATAIHDAGFHKAKVKE